MKIHFRRGQGIVFLDKPAGILTLASGREADGLLEWTEKRLGEKLWLVNALDKTTTGALVFATRKEKAEQLRTALTSGQMLQKFWFVTDRKSDSLEFAHQSRIEKHGSRFVSDPSSIPNSKTLFRRIKRSPFYELWQAEPDFLADQQVRLHAADAGLPILGDGIYGGSLFPHLCLHSLSLEITGEEVWNCPAPRIFERLGILRDLEAVRILSCIDRRQRLMNFLSFPEQCLRLIHTEHSDFRLDKFGSVLWLNWYKEDAPKERDLERWDFIRTLMRAPLVIQKRQNRGQDPNTQTIWELGDVPDNWHAYEGDLKFEFRKEQGLSAGLFLDQRLNRKRAREMAQQAVAEPIIMPRTVTAAKTVSPEPMAAQKNDESNQKGIKNEFRVLNLFAYTGGFSLAAAAGGATLVTTVDLSRSFIDWGQQNFKLNEELLNFAVADPTSSRGLNSHSILGLDSQIDRASDKQEEAKLDSQIDDEPFSDQKNRASFEWIAADSFVYLKGAAKRNRKWNLIICDPPSFSRSGKTVFKLKEDLEDLLKLCAAVLETRGGLLFSCNIESLGADEISTRVRKLFPLAKINSGEQDLDYELPYEERSLKSFWIQF